MKMVRVSTSNKVIAPLEEARYAHELMRDRNLLGKILLTQEAA
jgi:hypothetical protein